MLGFETCGRVLPEPSGMEKCRRGKRLNLKSDVGRDRLRLNNSPNDNDCRLNLMRPFLARASRDPQQLVFRNKGGRNWGLNLIFHPKRSFGPACYDDEMNMAAPQQPCKIQTFTPSQVHRTPSHRDDYRRMHRHGRQVAMPSYLAVILHHHELSMRQRLAAYHGANK